MMIPSTEVLAAIASAISALYAWRSAAIAKKALRISEAEHQEKQSGIQGYLIEGISMENENQERMTLFACTLSNNSSYPTSVTRCDLHIHALDHEERIFEYILQPEMPTTQDVWVMSPIALPLYLNPKETKSGWLEYKIPDRLTTEMSIDKYEIQFIQPSGKKASVETHLIQRIKNANTKA